MADENEVDLEEMMHGGRWLMMKMQDDEEMPEDDGQSSWRYER